VLALRGSAKLKLLRPNRDVDTRLQIDRSMSGSGIIVALSDLWRSTGSVRCWLLRSLCPDRKSLGVGLRALPSRAVLILSIDPRSML
jgi:hypothetical protein